MGMCSPTSAKKMLRLLVLVALASLCSAGGGYKEGLMKKYAHYKIQESCFGRDEVMKYKKMFMEASQKCSTGHMGEGSGHEFDFQEIINEIRSAALQGSGSHSNQYYKLVPAGRFRRDAHTVEEKLQHVQHKMNHTIGNMTCMLKHLNMINDDNSPNYKEFEKHINMINDAYLRDQLMYGYDCCKDYANCMPVQKSKNPMIKQLGTYIAFQQCMEMKKMEACFKKDFRYVMADYGYDAVEEKINMGLELIGEEVEKDGMEGYTALEDALMGKM